jgi:hypothetical protein
MAEKDMDSQDRRMMRHEKEQDRNIKKATSKYEKLVKQSDKALDLYGGTSKAYKKLKEKEKDAFRNMLDATKYMNKADRNTPSSRKIARQSKETATEKDMDVSISGQHPGTTKRKGGFASGGSVKNYAYGGSVAAMSAEKS